MYYSQSIPTTFVIDAEGGLALTHMGMADYDTEEFKKYLKKMLVLNAVCNKIIHPGGEPRVFTCIRDNRNRVAGRYEKNYTTQWPPLPLFKP